MAKRNKSNHARVLVIIGEFSAVMLLLDGVILYFLQKRFYGADDADVLRYTIGQMVLIAVVLIAVIAAMTPVITKSIDDILKTSYPEIKEPYRAKPVNIMDELAYRDSLTGIRNKPSYDQYAQRLGWGISSGTAMFGIAVVDMNHLKEINDEYGYEYGNLAIKNMCKAVCDIFAHSAVFRVGEDEFAIILERSDYENDDKLIDAFNRRIRDNSKKVGDKPWDAFSAAIGYARYENGIDSGVDSVFRRATMEMHSNKKEMEKATD